MRGERERREGREGERERERERERTNCRKRMPPVVADVGLEREKRRHVVGTWCPKSHVANLHNCEYEYVHTYWIVSLIYQKDLNGTNARETAISQSKSMKIRPWGKRI